MRTLDNETNTGAETLDPRIRALQWIKLILATGAGVYFTMRGVQRGDVAWITSVIVPSVIALSAAIALASSRISTSVQRAAAVGGALVIVVIIALELI